jgi:dihydroflavonol-4-reductase
MYWVTGATGLIGKHVLAYLLHRNENVVAFFHLQSPDRTLLWLKSQGISDAQLQLLSWKDSKIWEWEEAPAAGAVLMHCAAVVSYHADDHEAMNAVNVEETGQWVNWCLEHQIDLCHVSSIAAIGKAPEGKPADENCYWQPSKEHTEYARTKFLGEMEVWRGHEEGAQVVIVNPGVVIGECDPHQSTGVLFATVARKWGGYPDGGTGWVSAADVAKAMVQLVEKKCWGQRYILVAENQSMQWAFEQIADALQIKRPSWKVKNVHLKALWLLDFLKEKLGIKKASITAEAIRNTAQFKFFSSEKIEKELNFKFESMSEVIHKTGSTMRTHLPL